MIVANNTIRVWKEHTPAHWQVVPLKYVITYNEDKLSEQTDDDYEFDYVDIGSVTYGKGIENFQHMKFSDAPSRARRIVRSNDVIISTVRTYLKATAKIEEHDNPVIVSTGFMVMRARVGVILPDFLGYIAQSDGLVSEIECQSYGTSYPAINAGEIAGFSIPLPPLTEQSAIVCYLDAKCSAIDEAIERHKKIIEKLEEYKSEIITAHLLGLNHEDMKDSQIEWMGRIASNRQLWRLKFLLSTSLKYGANESGCAYDEQLPRYIRITDIDTSGKLKETGKQSLTEQQAKDYLLTDGTVLFARSGATVGKTFLYKESFGRAAFAGYLISAVPNKELILPEWLKYYTESIPYKNWKDSIFTQATIQNIGADKYSNLVIPLCSIAEQQMIVGRLNIAMNKINDVVEKHNRVIAKLEEYRKSIIYNAVTGKIDCRTEATG